jgi:hypothetical protein
MADGSTTVESMPASTSLLDGKLKAGHSRASIALILLSMGGGLSYIAFHLPSVGGGAADRAGF